jgi:hypothetical protein
MLVLTLATPVSVQIAIEGLLAPMLKHIFFQNWG